MASDCARARRPASRRGVRPAGRDRNGRRSADARLTFYNADGSLSATCGNATRCVARHADGGERAVDRRSVCAPSAGCWTVPMQATGSRGSIWARRFLTGTGCRWPKRWTRCRYQSRARPRCDRDGQPALHLLRRGCRGRGSRRTSDRPMSTHPLFPERTNVQVAHVIGARPPANAGLGARHRDHAGLRLLLLRHRRGRGAARADRAERDASNSMAARSRDRLARGRRSHDRAHRPCLRRRGSPPPSWRRSEMSPARLLHAGLPAQRL